MICPIMSTTVKKVFETSSPHYDNMIECCESECAWWQHDRCAVTMLADKLDQVVGLMAEEL